jgi:DNA-binding NarL/FixJ family response regulator
VHNPSNALRLAIYWPTPTARPVPSLTRRLGDSVRARLVRRPEEVRTSDDLVVVVAGARTFVPSLTDALGPRTPPVLVVVRRTDETRLPVSPGYRATGYLVVDRADLGDLVENLMSFAVLATARRVPIRPAPAGLAHAEPLTPRECDVMTLLAAGRDIREIAEALAIGGKTVRNNLSNIYRKLGVRRQTEALLRWLSIGEAQPST